ncbi:MAG: hypothetical protein HMLKMBBP_03987 [Planctomycetes bacterium]|nr:hypothetical protein [Planctomycetota bacterium]
MRPRRSRDPARASRPVASPNGRDARASRGGSRTARVPHRAAIAALLLAAAAVRPGLAAPDSQTDTFPTGLEGVGVIQDIARDASGNIFAVASVDAPGAVPAGHAGYSNSLSGPSDAWIAKFDAGGALVWATYLGGSGPESAAAVAVDPQGRVVVAGWTMSTDFPIVSGDRATPGTSGDAFVARISADGQDLQWSRTLGDSGNDLPASLAVGSDSAVYLAGTTSGTPFPVSFRPGPGPASNRAVWVAKLQADGGIAWTTDLANGAATTEQAAGRIAVDGSGAAYVCGTTYGAGSLPPADEGNEYHGGPVDGFVVKLAPSGRTLDYAVYLGGAAADGAGGLALDDAGAAWVAGATQSTVTTFPRRTGPDTGTTETVPGNGFLVKVSPSGVNTESAVALPATFWTAYEALGRFHGVDLDAQGRAWTVFGRLMRFSADTSVVDDFGTVVQWGIYGAPRTVGSQQVWATAGLSLVRVIDLGSGAAEVPASVTARPSGPRAVDLAWSARGNETSFIVERAGATGSFTDVGTVGGGTTAWTDTGLDPESNYRYRVRAVVGGETSSPSAFVVVRTSGTFGLRVASARLVNSPRARRDSVRLVADATFSARERFDPATQALRISVADGLAGAYVLDIPAGDSGWTMTARRAIWEAPSALPGTTTVTIDTRRDRIVVRATRTDLAGLPADPAAVVVRIGVDAASDEPVWVRRGDTMSAR